MQRVLGGDHRASGPADFDRFVEVRARCVKWSIAYDLQVLVIVGFAVLHQDAEEILLSPPSDLSNGHTLRLRRPSTNDGWWPHETI